MARTKYTFPNMTPDAQQDYHVEPVNLKAPNTFLNEVGGRDISASSPRTPALKDLTVCGLGIGKGHVPLLQSAHSENASASESDDASEASVVEEIGENGEIGEIGEIG
jgi:hypothetical protein